VVVASDQQREELRTRPARSCERSDAFEERQTTVNLFFLSGDDKKPKFIERPLRPVVTPKLEIVKTITGIWGVDIRFFDRYPRDFGNNTH
jgi:hypothetical protein